MAPQGRAYNVDWVVSQLSNVHVANHRDWFAAYTEFPSLLGHLTNPDAGDQVLGIGDVELEVRVSDRPGERATGRLLLEDVLHVPDFGCNVVGGPILDDYGLQMGSKAVHNRLYVEDTGATVALVEVESRTPH